MQKSFTLKNNFTVTCVKINAHSLLAYTVMRDTYNDQPGLHTMVDGFTKLWTKIPKSSQHERDLLNHDKFQCTKYVAEIA